MPPIPSSPSHLHHSRASHALEIYPLYNYHKYFLSMATSPATGPRSTRGNRPHARLINSLCTPGPMSRAQETTAALHTAGCHNHPPRVVGSSILSSSHPGQAPPDSLQALPDSLAVSFKNPGLVCAWDLIAENSAPVPSFQVSRAVQKFGLPYLVTEIKYWRQKLDFLIHQWLKIVKFLSSRCYISQEELRYALGVHQNRIAVLKMLISALYHMGQEAVK